MLLSGKFVVFPFIFAQDCKSTRARIYIYIKTKSHEIQDTGIHQGLKTKEKSHWLETNKSVNRNLVPSPNK